MKIVSLKNGIVNLVIISICLSVIVFVIAIAPPDDSEFPLIFEIEAGDSLGDIAERADSEGLIRSPLLFRAFVIIFDGERKIPAGKYYFNELKPVYAVARRVSEGEYGLEPLRVTIIEGWTMFDVADTLEERFKNFDRKEFFSIAEEGYLAPDTYFFSPLSSTEELVNKMKENSKLRLEKIKELEPERPMDEIVIMASILEREANTVESKRKVADVLWKRFDVGMPLQVDASFVYVNNKHTYQLTLDDLRIDNPYNTYRYAGFPPTPIANPGLTALKAAADPIENPYWYFLSDLAGNMYYARDFDEHQYNRKNYLRQ